MSWHWIFREPQLSGDEKLVALAIRSHQNGDVPTMVGSATIAADCGRSVRQVNRCKQSLERFGILVVKTVRTKRGPAHLYQILQKQTELFDPATKRTVSPGQPRDGTVSPCISVSTSVNSKDKYRAEVRPRATFFPNKTKQERQLQAEINAGKGPQLPPGVHVKAGYQPKRQVGA